MRNTFTRDIGHDFKDSKLWRIRRKAKKYIQGYYIKQYKELWNYSHALLERNSGAYCKIKVHPNSLPNQPVFGGFFLSYSAQVTGFKDACRLFIGLDGGFMKTEVGGVLLSATSRDANNQMFPLAVAVVTKESKQSWC